MLYYDPNLLRWQPLTIGSTLHARSAALTQQLVNTRSHMYENEWLLMEWTTVYIIIIITIISFIYTLMRFNFCMWSIIGILLHLYAL